MDVTHLFGGGAAPEAAPAAAEPDDAIMDVELFDDEPEPPQAAAPAPAPAPPDPAASGGDDEIFDGFEFESPPQPQPQPSAPPPPPPAGAAETFMARPEALLDHDGDGAIRLGEHDLDSLDHDSGALSVDGTEFADVDHLLDDLDDEE
jgi:hypothetical protein